MFTSSCFRFITFSAACVSVFGQDYASISGVVVDPNDRVVSGAAVTLTSIQTRATREATTDAVGAFRLDAVTPGRYVIEAAKEGFGKFTLPDVQVGARESHSLRLKLRAATSSPLAANVAGAAAAIGFDLSEGASLEHSYVKDLPLRRRDVQPLIRFAPGVVIANDQIVANGLRPDMNYYTLDGVSADVAGLPIDSIQAVEVQTSTLAVEFGRTPGAQIAVDSRAGGNNFHGVAYDYFRNGGLDANDWFANSAGLARANSRHNQFGGAFGGPVVRNRSYFFLSYEGSRIREPQTAVVDVPDLNARAAAPAALQPFLDAFPLPNGPATGDGAARFSAAFLNPVTTDMGSARFDHTFNDRWSVFARYSYTPSERTSRGDGLTTPNVVTGSESTRHAFTTSLQWRPTPTSTNDLRVNVSTLEATSSSAMDSLGGAVPLTDSQVFPQGIDSGSGEFRVNIAGIAGYSYAERRRNEQSQINIVNNLTNVNGLHQFKFGVDFRRTAATYFNRSYRSEVTFNGLSGKPESLTSAKVNTAVVSSSDPAVYPMFLNLSLYVQDLWKASERTTVTWGLRWDINPAPSPRQGQPLLALGSDGVTVTRFQPLYQTSWKDLGPRLGLAYLMDDTEGREMTFRIGAGLYHDPVDNSMTSAFLEAPFSSDRILALADFPLSASNLAPPALPATRPYGQVTAVDSVFKSPAVYHWSATLERMFGPSQVLTLGYAGAAGQRLLRFEGTAYFSGGYDLLHLISNGAMSRYHGFQAQYRRRMTRNLQTLISYTYGHSLDTASGGRATSGFATVEGGERGHSDFDVRHTLSFSGSYGLPSPRRSPAGAFLRDWWLEWVATARSGLPIDVLGISAVVSETAEDEDDDRGLYALVRPNYTGEALWIADPNVAGGRRLNTAAFTTPEGFAQGSLGRNTLRGLGMWQVDFSLRRQVPVGERARVQIMAQAFNILNHPSFGNLSPLVSANLASPSFGIASRSSSEPRSIQLALRVEF